MKVLAVDTSTRCCSVAYKDGDRTAAEFSYVSGQTHSKHLMSIIGHILAVADVTLEDVDFLVVGLGPGSFTGLRIGISTMQGMSMATGLPLLGFSGLEALAWQVAEAGCLICPMIDARRKEVYYGRYRFKDKRLSQVKPAGVAKLSRALEGIEDGCILIGNGTAVYHSEINRFLEQRRLRGTILNHHVSAAAMAAAVMHLRLTEHGGSERNLKPIYLRKSDAEIALAHKSGQAGE